MEISGPWTITSGEQTLSQQASLPDPRTIEAFKHTDQPLVYSTDFEFEPGEVCPCPARLSLGRVEGVAEVRVNGTDVQPTGITSLQIDISGAVQPGRNSLVITVTPPRRNELVGKALAGDPLLQQVLPQQDELSPMGLLGPVRLGRLAPAPTPPLSTDSE